MDDIKLEVIDQSLIDKTRYMPTNVYLDYSKIYPNAGLGVFAKEIIKKGSFLGNYVGEIRDKDHKGPYVFSVIVNGEQLKIDSIDINKSNYTRYMNCALNQQDENVIVIRCENEGLMNGKLCFFAKRNILIDEELCFDYGDEYKEKLFKLNKRIKMNQMAE